MKAIVQTNNSYPMSSFIAKRLTKTHQMMGNDATRKLSLAEVSIDVPGIESGTSNPMSRFFRELKTLLELSLRSGQHVLITCDGSVQKFARWKFQYYLLPEEHPSSFGEEQN